MKNIIYIFLISILPIIELRGAIPVGAALGVPFYWNYLCAVVGNMLPVPFILLFIPKILDFLARFKIFRPVVEWVRKKADKHSAKIVSDGVAAEKNAEAACEESSEVKAENEVQPKKKRFDGAFWGLLLFVMIPLPGTGAWTGSLIAALFDLPKRRSFLAALLGVLGAGVIMCLASYGVVGFLKIFI
ncbi:MAG: small multi-drug export protein [Clostridia bacterium]|nr:small multi-drug export protein [Clostridia bacterium]MBQ8269540.1 small multi-drug export protein [Clostridia bacterium]